MIADRAEQTFPCFPARHSAQGAGEHRCVPTTPGSSHGRR